LRTRIKWPGFDPAVARTQHRYGLSVPVTVRAIVGRRPLPSPGVF
jgi:hypothetical protein